jgi:hypothetical protein
MMPAAEIFPDLAFAVSGHGEPDRLRAVAAILTASQERFGRPSFDDLVVILPRLVAHIEMAASELRGETAPKYGIRLAGWSASRRRFEVREIDAARRG